MCRRVIDSLLMLCCIAAPQSAFCGDHSSLKVATYNICYGNIDVPLMARTIRECDADIVCLQETTPESERYLRTHLRSVYPSMHFRGHGGPYYAERFGVLSKRPVARLTYHRPPGRYFGFVEFESEYGGVPVNFVTVHLAPFHLRQPNSVREVMGQLSATEVEHSREMKVILKSIDVQKPVVVLGDFNSLSGFQAPRMLQAAGLTDSFAAVTKNPDSFPTWVWPLRVGEVKFRIDYIFHSGHLETVDSGVAKAKASDHRLLWSSFRLAAPDSSRRISDQ